MDSQSTTTTTTTENVTTTRKRKLETYMAPCKRCGDETEHYSHGGCKPCNREASRRSYLAKKEKAQSGDRFCDKCEATTHHYATGGCSDCFRRYDSQRDFSGMAPCDVCKTDTDHNKRGKCKPCERNEQLCVHGIRTHSCHHCLTPEQLLRSGRWCVNCLSKWLSPARRNAGMQMCAECDPNVPERIELVLRPKFEELIGPAHLFDQKIGGKGCGSDDKWTKPDMLWLTCDDDFANMRIVVIECDEDSHVYRESSCEAARMSKQHEALQSAARQEFGAADVPIVFLRYNPDAYDGGRVSGEDRIATVSAEARRILFDGGWRDFAPHCPHVAYFYYHSKGRKHIDHMLAHPDSAVVYKQV